MYHNVNPKFCIILFCYLEILNFYCSSREERKDYYQNVFSENYNTILCIGSTSMGDT